MMTVVYGAMKNLACHFKPLAHTVRIQPHFRAVRSQLTLKTKNKQINKQRKHSNIKIIRLWVISPLHELLASNSEPGKVALPRPSTRGRGRAHCKRRVLKKKHFRLAVLSLRTEHRGEYTDLALLLVFENTRVNCVSI